MKEAALKQLACPLDGLSMTKYGQSMQCTNNHSFDFDKKGAINLLPVQFKKSLQPGDSKEMVQARETFLKSGIYQSISNKLNEIVPPQSQTVFDAGCGEGYYTDRLSQHLKNASVIGMDISKYAIQAASRKNTDILWITGTNAKIPLQNHSVDCIVSLFGFPVWPEFIRILKPDGKVILADPGPDHLIELRRILYPEIKEKNPEKITPDNFIELTQERLTITVTPPSPKLLELQIMMTPHGYRSTPEKIKEAVEFSYKQMTLDIFFSIYGGKVSL